MLFRFLLIFSPLEIPGIMCIMSLPASYVNPFRLLNPWEWCHRLSNPVFYFETWKYYCLFSNRKTKRSILIIDNLANDMYFMSRLWHHLHAQLFMVTCIHNIFTGSILNACIFYQLLLIVIIKFSWKLFWYIFYSTTKSCSAYSIFNEDFRELPGTLNADRLDRDIRAGQFWALLHCTLSNHPNTTDVKSHAIYLHNHKEIID